MITPTPAPYTWLALGDSYTIGECVAETECFPMQTAARLQQNGIPMGMPRIIATTGWTTDELAAGIMADGVTGIFDIVTLLIGVNNQYRGRPLDNYIAEFTGLLQQALTFAGDRPERVVVLSIPDWGVTPYAADRDRVKIAAEIDAYNAANKAVALEKGVAYVDITPFTREAVHNPALVAGDGLHPSAVDYARWAELLAKVVETKLR